jgi:hypothetical protein
MSTATLLFTVPHHRYKQASLNKEYRGHKQADFETCPPLGRLPSLNLLQNFNSTFSFLDSQEKYCTSYEMQKEVRVKLTCRVCVWHSGKQPMGKTVSKR